MGFFKDFKEDLNETASDFSKNSSSDEEMVNTLRQSGKVDPELAKLSAQIEMGKAVGDEEPKSEDEKDGTAETAVITKGLTVSGNLDSTGSIDIYGTVTGDVTCAGALNITGILTGNSKAGNVKADGARIEGNIVSEKAADILKDCVVIGDITASSTFIAGAVKGNIDVKGPVVIDSTAVIIGDIKSQTLQINSGATIDGRCTQCYSEINTAQIFEKKEEAADDNLQEAVAEKESQPEPEQRNIDDVLDNIAAGKMSSSADIKDEYVNTLEK